jgi:hypothetical protein
MTRARAPEGADMAAAGEMALCCMPAGYTVHFNLQQLAIGPKNHHFRFSELHYTVRIN